MSVINALSSASVGAIGLLVLLLLIDIGFGVLRSLTSSIQTARGHQLTIKGFDWTYLGNFARSVLFSPPVLAVAGSLWAAAQTSGATSTSILAAGSAAALTQDVILLRDIVVKIRDGVRTAVNPSALAVPLPAIPASVVPNKATPLAGVGTT